MPRTVSRQAIERAKATAYPETRSETPATLSPDQMRSMLFKTPPKRDTYGRTRFGRNLNVDRIEKALASAQYGLMRELTDLGRETVATDPHLAAVLNKRINAVSALPFDIIAAEGPGIDPKKAEANAELVRSQISRIPHFRQAIRQLAWALFDGRSALEIQWIQRPSAQGTSRTGSPYPEPKLDWVAAELQWIHPRRLSFGPQRELRISDESYASGFAPIGLALRDYAFKFIEFKPQLFGDYPELEGICPRAVYWSFFKRFGQRDRMILLELFGKPWRIVTVDPESSAGLPDLLDAEAAADELGGNATTARMPRGTKLETITVGKNAGEVHADVIVYSDSQISKLVLGQTGTTDAQNSGLGSNQPGVMQGEQTQILQGDAELVSEALEDGLSDAIVALNRGIAELDHAPRFVLRTEVPGDPTAEAGRLKAVLDSGLPVAAEQAYEVVGFRRPTDADDTVVYEPVTMPDGTSEMRPVLKPAVKPAEENQADDVDEIIKQADEAFKEESPVQRFAIAPADFSAVVTVNEARENAGLPKLLNPDGSDRPEGLMTLVEFKAKYSPTPFGGAPPSSPTTPKLPGEEPPKPPGGGGGAPPAPQKPGAPEVPTPDAAPPSQAPAGEEKPVVVPSPFKIKTALERTIDEFYENAEQLSHELESVLCSQMTGVAVEADEHQCRVHSVELAKQAQPSTVHGTLEDLIDKGVKEGAREVAKWADKYAAAVAGKTTAAQLYRAINQAHESLETNGFARLVERRISQSMMTGSLDSQWEGLEDEAIKPEAFEAPVAASRAQLAGKEVIAPAAAPGTAEIASVEPAFTTMSYKSALKYFTEKAPIPKSTFARMSAAMKARSFTVAGLASEQALGVAQSELTNSIVEGTDLKDFGKRLSQRFEEAGLSKLNPSHVETIFRTNVLDTYNIGRKAEMSQPATLKARPYWLIRTVQDARQRPAHKVVSNWAIRADDPFWSKIGGPPWGYNCRCRTLAIKESRAQSLGIRMGAEIRGIPDDGFTPNALVGPGLQDLISP
jgi:phage gp29-like protein